ncbi:Zinc finger protein 780B [Nymphon striatum]|nr:Zinc finger protein 780B [Nymphon striatum]
MADINMKPCEEVENTSFEDPHGKNDSNVDPACDPIKTLDDSSNKIATEDGSCFDLKNLPKLQECDLKQDLVNLNQTNEPVQVQKVDSSEKTASHQNLLNQNVEELDDSTRSSYRFLLKLPNGSQFIVPGNFNGLKPSNTDSLEPKLSNSMPAGLIHILPSVLSQASSVIHENKKEIENSPNKISPPGMSLVNRKVELSHSLSSLFIQIPTATTPLPSYSNPSLRNIHVQLCPLSPSHITDNKVEIIGPPLSPAGYKTNPTFLITFGDAEESGVSVEVDKSDDNLSVKGNAVQRPEKLDIQLPIQTTSKELPTEPDKNDKLCLKKQLDRQFKVKQIGVKKKRRGKKRSIDLDVNFKPQFDRLICSICPEPSENPNSSLELNCNEVGPTYGIRITQTVSRCFVCTAELKSVRDVWQHAITDAHKEKVHNLLVDQSKKRKGLPIRQSSPSKSTIDPTPCVQSNYNSHAMQTLNESTSTSETKQESDSKVSNITSFEDRLLKTDSVIDNQICKKQSLSEDTECAEKINFETLEMPKLTEEKVRLTRNRKSPFPQKTFKRRRKLSENSTDSLPVLEKITCSVNTCSVCGIEFDDVVQKLDHAMTQHEEYKEILGVLASVVHSALENEELRACMVCKKVYNGVENLLSHFIAAHQIKPRMLENVELSRQVVARLLEKKYKPSENAKVPVPFKPSMITPLITEEEISPRTCQYCNRTYTTENRLLRHYKLTGHKKMILKRNRHKKKCEHCNRTFKSVVACKSHVKRTVPNKDGGPCKMKPRGASTEDESSKKAIVRVPGGGIKEAIPIKNNLTCVHCNEVFSTVHTFHLHSRTTTPTENGCAPVTPSFKIGGGKSIFSTLKVSPAKFSEISISKCPTSVDNACDFKDKPVSEKEITENSVEKAHPHIDNITGTPCSSKIKSEEVCSNNLKIKSKSQLNENNFLHDPCSSKNNSEEVCSNNLKIKSKSQLNENNFLHDPCSSKNNSEEVCSNNLKIKSKSQLNENNFLHDPCSSKNKSEEVCSNNLKIKSKSQLNENNFLHEPKVSESNVVVDKSSHLSKTDDSLSCKFCFKKFASTYARFMHNRLTYFKEETKTCVRPNFRRKGQNSKHKLSVRRKQKGPKRRRIRKKKILMSDYDNDLESETFFQEIKSEADYTEEKSDVLRTSQTKDSTVVVSNPKINPDKFKIEPKLEIDLHDQTNPDSLDAAVENTSKTKHFNKDDCFCRICFKVLSTPWNRNAHERNIHEYDFRSSDLTPMASLLPTMKPVSGTSKNQSEPLIPEKEKEFKCMVCQQSYDDLKKLNDHYETTKHNVKYQSEVSKSECKYCKKKFASEFLKSLHQQGTIPVAITKKCVPVVELEQQGIKLSERTTCQLCSKDFVSAVHRFRHENIAHRSYFLKKKLAISSSSGIEEPGFKLIKLASNNKIISSKIKSETTKSCKVCHQEFYSASQLQMHYAKAHYNKSAINEINHEKIVDLNSQISANSQLDSSFESGQYSLLSEDNLVDNEMSPTHSGGNSIEKRTCYFCQKVFTKVWNCKVHIRTVHGMKGQIEKVTTDVETISKSSRKSKSPSTQDNANIHSVKSPHDPVFPGLYHSSTKSSMTVTPFVNTDDSNKPCSSTKVQFSALHKSGNQKMPSPFACVRCKRTYTSADRLQKHYFLTSHNDQKAMAAITDSCPCCKKGFKSLRALKIHMRVTVPDHDDGTCTYRVGLEIMRAQSSQDKNPTSKTCGFCPREFATPWHRKVHEARSHNSATESRIKKHEILNQTTPKTPHSENVLVPGEKWLLRNSAGRLTRVNNRMLKKLCRVCNKIFTTVWYMRAHVKKNHLNMLQQHLVQKFEGEYLCPTSPVICTLATPRNFAHEKNPHDVSSPMKALLSTLPVSPKEKSQELKASLSENVTPGGEILKSLKNRCKICKRGFKWHSALEEHEKSCSLKSLAYKCRVCGVMFRDRRQLGPHCRKHKEIYELGTASDMFISLEQHALTVQPDHSSRSNISLTARMQGREMARPYVASTSLNNQEATSKTNIGGKHLECYRCAGCNKIFMNAVKFIQHRLTHFSESSVTEISDKKPFCCEVLEHHTLVQVHLLEHLRVERRKSCFVHNQVLKPGMLIRSSSPIPESDSQEAKESRESEINSSMIKPTIVTSASIHKPVRRYSCKFCKKRFTSMAKYLTHVRTNQCKVRQEVKNQVWQQMKHVQETGKFAELKEKKHNVNDNSVQANDDLKKCVKLEDRYIWVQHIRDRFWTATQTARETSGRYKNGNNYERTEIKINDCRFCGNMFQDFHFRENHELLQCEENTFCKICAIQFQSSMEGISHADLHHQNTMIRCTPCCLTFSDFEVLDAHVSSLHCKQPDDPLSKSSLTKNEISTKNADRIETDNEEDNVLAYTNVRLVLDSDSDDHKSVSQLEIDSDKNKTETISNVKCLIEENTLKKEIFDDSNRTEQKSTTNYEEHPLRKHFTELLGILLGDDALLLELGWKNRPIDIVLKDVMSRTGMDTVEKTEQISELDCLRENINLMLAASLEDTVQETVGLGSKPVDEIVQEMLLLSQSDELNE